MKTLLINNFSPFIVDIEKILNDFGNEAECYNCDEILAIDTHLDFLENFDNVILSGRQRNSTVINKVNSRIVKGALVLNKPLLGICYGAQILALTLGCTLKRMGKVRDLINIKVVQQDPIIKGYDEMEMYESHNFCISVLSPDFKLLGKSISCTNELFCLKNKPIYGTQFHPERSGKPGRDLIENFLKIR
ncbi:glutamine amidotransferase-related protein [Candidatus Nitrosocosmicus agrestis]|uniref:glutamine amidotransferase-related protein n=1 Tax=Candidatus Nitrosocosmicus agrestis TaxID=2563600 RepID=UPI0013318139|nr:gamma-glutamyl-gamma-aminobutyrate hydrolase family protein [Candidatus Nitrosocosmicus sp. SS]MDR4490864.1 gamma-glutamyl-gamma-aminobutyrate hydrolase family protein [Candidatus Nitrosocosmicus sp.]